MDTLIYAQRRARLAQQLTQRLGPRSVAVLPTAGAHMRNRDSEHLYRCDSYFYYLTGFAEPEACLVLEASGRSTLFCQAKNLEREIWDGYRLGVEAAPAALGVDAACAIEELDSRLPGFLENQEALAYPFGVHQGWPERVSGCLSQVQAQSRRGVLAPAQQWDLCVLLDEMRLFKDAHELALMRRAAGISAGAHVRAMRRCAQGLRAGEDLREYHLDAELLHEFRRQGSQAPAYNSIVAAGANACVLHYRADAAPIRDGDLVLIDAGCELNGYASDITRTFPANGRFSGPQKAVYELVLAAQQAAIANTHSGARFNEAHQATVRVLTQGLFDLGLLSHDRHGDVDEAVAQAHYRRFYMHRTGHWLGLDVHDCGSYLEPTEIDQTRTYTDPATGQAVVERPSRILRPGMVLTIEPGLYIRPAADVPAHFHNIGVRIEDDAIVTAQGCELISREVPVAVAEVEALMRA